MIGGQYEAVGTLSRPLAGNIEYEGDWDKDPYYEEGDSGSEQWR